MEVGPSIKDLKERDIMELRDLIEQFLENKKNSEPARELGDAAIRRTPELPQSPSITPPERSEFDSSTLSGPSPGKGLRASPQASALWSNASPTLPVDSLLQSDETLRKRFLDTGRSHSGSSINSVEHPSHCWPSPVGASSATTSIQMAATAAGAAPSVVDQFASTQGASFVRCGSSVSSRGSPSRTATHSPTTSSQLEAHSCDEPSATQRNQLFKTELCRTYMETGRCRYGSKCQFAHGHCELRPVKRHPKYKTKICRNFAETGSCPYGSRCRFIHGPTAPTSEVDEELMNAVREVSIGYFRDEADREIHQSLPILRLLQGLDTNARHQPPVGTNVFSRAPGSASTGDSGW